MYEPFVFLHIWNMKWLSYVLVFVQFSILIFFALSGNLLPKSWPLIIAESLGIFIGLWAIVVMNQDTLSVFPEPKKTGNLITGGPYQFIRHPMYTAILLVCLALTLADPTLIKGILFFVLLVNQLVKLHVEEKMLIDRYPEYEAYRKSTKKIIPYLF